MSGQKISPTPVLRDNPDSDTGVTGRVESTGFERGDCVKCSVHVNACSKVEIYAFLSFLSFQVRVAAHEIDFLL